MSFKQDELLHHYNTPIDNKQTAAQLKKLKPRHGTVTQQTNTVHTDDDLLASSCQLAQNLNKNLTTSLTSLQAQGEQLQSIKHTAQTTSSILDVTGQMVTGIKSFWASLAHSVTGKAVNNLKKSSNLISNINNQVTYDETHGNTKQAFQQTNTQDNNTQDNTNTNGELTELSNTVSNIKMLAKMTSGEISSHLKSIDEINSINKNNKLQIDKQLGTLTGKK